MSFFRSSSVVYHVSETPAPASRPLPPVDTNLACTPSNAHVDGELLPADPHAPPRSRLVRSSPTHLAATAERIGTCSSEPFSSLITPVRP